MHDRLAALESWDESGIEGAFDAVREQHGGIGMGKLAQPVRVAVTGTSASPGIFETRALLGQQRAVGRIAEAIHYLRNG